MIRTLAVVMQSLCKWHACRHGLHDMTAYAKYMEGAVDNIIHTDEQLHQVCVCWVREVSISGVLVGKRKL